MHIGVNGVNDLFKVPAWPGIEPMTCRSQVRRSVKCAATPPYLNRVKNAVVIV